MIEQPQPQQEQPQSQQGQYSEYFEGIAKPQPEELIVNWQAPSRAFKKHNKQYMTTVITIVLLLSLILFFAGQFLPIAVVIAVAFMVYVMGSIPPHTIENVLTTYGIRSEDNLYYWEELGRFWFIEKYGQKILMIEVSRFPNRLTLLLGNLLEDDVREILSEVLLEERPSMNQTEKFADWLQRKVPIDIES